MNVRPEELAYIHRLLKAIGIRGFSVHMTETGGRIDWGGEECNFSSVEEAESEIEENFVDGYVTTAEDFMEAKKTMMTMNVYEQVSQAVEAGENSGEADVRVLPFQWGHACRAADSILSPTKIEEHNLRLLKHGVNHPFTSQPAMLFLVVDAEHPAPNGRDEIDFRLWLSVIPHDEH